MTWNGVHAYSTTTASNSTINGTNIAVGCPPSDVGVFMRQAMADIASYVADVDNTRGVTCTVGGTSDAIVLTPPTSIAVTLTAGLCLRFKATAGNTTTTPTVAAGGLAATTIQKNGAALAAGDITSGQTYELVYDGTCFQLFGIAPITQGKHALWIPATAMTGRVSSGAVVNLTETATNKVDYRSLDFTAGSNLYAQFGIRLPKSWNGGTVTAIFAFTQPSTSAGTVTWGIQGLALASGGAIDTAFGTAQEVTTTAGTAGTLYLSAETAATTIANSPAAGDWVVFQLYRKGASDTLAVTANLIGLTLYLTYNAGNDA